MKNVILVRTEIPEETDLNKLFELINGRGQQLSQTDILKSHILNLIREETDKNEDLLIRYGQIWNACADMNEYVEHNIQQEDPSLTWKDRLIYDKKSDGDEEGGGVLRGAARLRVVRRQPGPRARDNREDNPSNSRCGRRGVYRPKGISS